MNSCDISSFFSYLDPIRAIQFSPVGQCIAVAVGRHIRVFHNVPGYKNIILDLEECKRNATNASMKDRLQSQIEEAKYVNIFHMIFYLHMIFYYARVWISIVLCL